MVACGLVGTRFKPQRRNGKAIHFLCPFRAAKLEGCFAPRLEYMEFHSARSRSLHRSVSVKVNSCFQVSNNRTTLVQLKCTLYHCINGKIIIKRAPSPVLSFKNKTKKHCNKVVYSQMVMQGGNKYFPNKLFGMFIGSILDSQPSSQPDKK